MGKEVVAYKAKRSDFKKDLNNANAGTPEGQALIKQSVQETGFHRGLFADKNGYIGGGNKTFTAAEGEGFEDVIVVETTGETPVIIKRMDFDLNAADPNNPARRAAYYDNITAIVDIELDPSVLMGDMAAGIDIESIISEDLLGELLAGSDASLDGDEWGEGFGKVPTEDRAAFQQMTFTLHDSEVDTIKKALTTAWETGKIKNDLNENKNGMALNYICEVFINAHS